MVYHIRRFSHEETAENSYTGMGSKSRRTLYAVFVSINLAKITLYKNDRTKPGDTSEKEKIRLTRERATYGFNVSANRT